MKKQCFLFILSLSMIFIACKKDSDKPSSTNYMEFDGKSYGLSKGFFIKYGPYAKDVVYEFDIYMYSGMTIYDPDSVVGSGPIVGFCIYSPSEDIQSGIYNYSSNYGDPFTFCYGHYQLEWVPENWTEIVAGTVSISVENNNKFDISFEGTSENGKTIKGRYKGTPDWWDDTW